MNFNLNFTKSACPNSSLEPSKDHASGTLTPGWIGNSEIALLPSLGRKTVSDSLLSLVHQLVPDPAGKSSYIQSLLIAGSGDHLARQMHFAKVWLASKYSWTSEQIRQASPSQITEAPMNQGFDLIRLFDPGDVIWIGGVFQSGKSQHAIHFNTREEWLEQPWLNSDLICPCTFKPGSISRGKEHILHNRFFVIGSCLDAATNPTPVSSVLRWAKEELSMHLRAVVETGPTGLQGWFDYPSALMLKDLANVLPEVAWDHELLKPNTPVPFLGCGPSADYRRLIYLDLNPQTKTQD